MHPYTAADARFRYIILMMAILAIAFAWLLGAAFDAVGVDPPWWLDTPAVLGFFGILWRLYDARLWRLAVGSRSISGIPDISGSWKGELMSSHGDDRYPVEVAIQQTATQVLIVLTTSHSESRSTMAALERDGSLSPVLRYRYENRPRALTPPTMLPHSGFAHLRWDPVNDELAGEYENDRFRGTHGRISVSRTRVG